MHTQRVYPAKDNPAPGACPRKEHAKQCQAKSAQRAQRAPIRQPLPHRPCLPCRKTLNPPVRLHSTQGHPHAVSVCCTHRGHCCCCSSTYSPTSGQHTPPLLSCPQAARVWLGPPQPAVSLCAVWHTDNQAHTSHKTNARLPQSRALTQLRPSLYTHKHCP